MKKVIFIFFGLLFFIFLIGFFTPKNLSLNQINPFQEFKPIIATSSKSFSEIPQIFQEFPYLSLMSEFQRKLDEGFQNLTKDLTPDPEKTLAQYRENLAKLQEKIKIPANTQEISPDIFFNLAKELASIRPPSIYYSFHLELIKTYYALGLALKEAQETDDLFKKFIWYNYLKNLAEKMSF